MYKCGRDLLDNHSHVDLEQNIVPNIRKNKEIKIKRLNFKAYHHGTALTGMSAHRLQCLNKKFVCGLMFVVNLWHENKINV